MDHSIYEKHLCPVCGKQFRKKNYLTLHLKAHDDVPHDLYKCKVCQKTYKKKEYFEQHQLKHDGSTEKPTCLTCGKQFKRKVYLKSHQRIHDGVKYECQVCGKKYGKKYDLKTHQLEHDGKTVTYQCVSCGKVYTNKSALVQHEKLHWDNNGKPKCVCQICGKQFDTIRILSNHQRIHNVSNPSDINKCEVCGITFRRKADLTRHQLNHEGRFVKFPCDSCGKVYSTVIGLYTHKRTEHSNYAKPKCRICNKEFKKKAYLKIHEQRHNVLRKSDNKKCKVCGITFSRKEELMNHQLNHKDLSDIFSCNSCNELFTSLTDLNQHIRSKHSHNEKHLSSVRGKKYDKKEHVLKHPQQVHGKILKDTANIYKCRVCRTTYKKKEDFKRHQQQHAKFKCDICDEAFPYIIGIWKHKRVKHPTGKLTNSVCAKKFNREDRLTQHQQMRRGTYLDQTKPKQGIHKCKNCGVTFLCEIGLRIHLDQKSCFKAKISLQSIGLQVKKKYKRIIRKKTNANPKSSENIESNCNYHCCETVFNSRKTYLMHTFRHHRKNYQLLKLLSYTV